MQIDPMQSVLAQMRSLAPPRRRSKAISPPTLKTALDDVNGALQQANALQQQFISGAADVSLSDVMLASQKASLSFQAALQVRNKLVSAYQDIMNIQA